MTDREKLEMTKPLRDFVDHWFFDIFCKAADCKDQREFIDRAWDLYNCKNDKDVDACIDAAIENGLIVVNYLNDIKEWLAEAAMDVLWEFFEDGDLPEEYAEVFDEAIDDYELANKCCM